MRKIQFRGLYEGKWVYGSYHNSADRKHHYILAHEKFIVHDGGYMSIHDKEVWEVEEKSVGQFTGLKDKNGKLIYEGDVIKYKDLEGLPLKVFFNECAASFDYEYPETHECEPLGSGNDSEDYIIVGNIYENPELLKESNL